MNIGLPWEKLAHAAPAFALAVVGIPVYLYIIGFYTVVVGINITVLGHIILSVRIFDAGPTESVLLSADWIENGCGRKIQLLPLHEMRLLTIPVLKCSKAPS